MYLTQTHFDVSVWAWEKLADKKWGVIGEPGGHVGEFFKCALLERSIVTMVGCGA